MSGLVCDVMPGTAPICRRSLIGTWRTVGSFIIVHMLWLLKKLQRGCKIADSLGSFTLGIRPALGRNITIGFGESR